MNKMQKRKFTIPLSVILLAAFSGAGIALSLSARAAGESAVDGITGEGTKENPYALDSVADLQQFAQNVNGGNSYAGKYVALTSNIDFKDDEGIVADMQAIGTKETPFQGVFDGGGYTVSELYITDFTGEEQDEYAGKYVGLFGYTVGATIQNVTVRNPYIVGQSYVGGIVGCAYTGEIRNCHVTGEIDIEGYYKVGGITGGDYATIYDCSVVGDEDWDYSVIMGVYKQADLEGDNVGGIVGYNAEAGTISGCTVKNVAVSGTRKIGGVAGTAFQNNTIENCTVSNVTVSTNATEEYASQKASSMGIGGIVGLTSSDYTGGTINGCSVENITLAVENDLTTYVSAGAITGGHRGTSSPIAPTATAYENNTTTKISGATSDYLNVYVKVGDEEYSSLAEAIENADGNTVSILANTRFAQKLTISKDKKFTLDLSGYTVKYETTVAGEAMITNYGEVVLTDSVGDGKISFIYSGVADTSYGKGNYTISNAGTLTVNAGKIENATAAMSHACYAIDNNSIGAAATLVVSGGEVVNKNNYAVRQIAGANKNSVTVNGGTIEGTRAVWVQLPGSDTSVAPIVELTVNDGTLIGNKVDSSDNKLAVYSYSYGNDMKNVTMRINGGVFEGDVALTGGKNKTNIETVTVTGGTIHGRWGEVYSYGDDGLAAKAITITGGTFSSSYAAMYCSENEGFTCTETVLGVKAQTNAAGDAIRFVAAVDTLAYDEVGFEIAFNGKTVTRSITQVYTSFKANGVQFTAESAFGVADGYLFAFTVTGVPAEYQDTAFTVRAYRKTETGAIIYSAYSQLKITDGLNA